MLLVQRGYLLVYILQRVGMAVQEAGAPAFQSGNLAYPTNGLHHQPFAIAHGEEIEGQQAEAGNDGHDDGDGGRQRQVADKGEGHIEEHREEPEPEVGEDVHHGIEDDRGGGMVLLDVLREFDDAVGLAAQSAHRRGVVEGIAGDGQAVDPEKRHMLVGGLGAADDAPPRPGIDAVDDDPHSDDRQQPVAGMADVIPQFDETDVEGEHHHHHHHHAKDEEQVIDALLGPLHFDSQFYYLQLALRFINFPSANHVKDSRRCACRKPRGGAPHTRR